MCSTDGYRRRARSCAAAAVLALCGVCAGSAEEPTASLHERIDRLVAARQLNEPAVVDDLGFLRRVTLDLAGRVPTVREAREFLADPSPVKRAAVVDRLLAGDEYPRQWARTLDIMFMERRGGTHVKTAELREWFRQALLKDKPLNELCRELLEADGTPGPNRPAAAFYLERAAEPNLMAREVGRMFLGMDLQCAQCHDHPLISSYHQSDYFGLFAFVSRTSVFQPDKKKPALLADSATALAQFKSVFTERESLTQPRLPHEAETADPFFEPGDEYVVAPAKNVRPQPRYSRRMKLAELIGSGKNELFRRNMANRIWAAMLGRGIVHPVDLHHSENPPSNPPLLELLSTELARNDFRLRSFLREIALSRTYQVAYVPLRAARGTDLLAERSKLVSEREQSRSLAEPDSDRFDTAIEAVDAAFAKASPARTAWEKSQKSARDLAAKLAAATAALKAGQAALEAKKSVHDALHQAEVAARSAAGLLQDSELSAIADTLKNRVDSAAADVSRRQAEVRKLTASQAAADKSFQPARNAALGDAEKLKPLLGQLQKARAALITARRDMYVHDMTVDWQTLRLEDLDETIAATDRARRIRQLESRLPSDRELLTKSRTQLAALTAETAAARATLAGVREAMLTAESRRSALADALESLTESEAQLAEAMVQLRHANVGADPTLSGMASVAASLQKQSAEVTRQLTPLQQQVTNAAQQLADAEAAVMALEQRQEVASTAATTKEKSVAEAERELQGLVAADKQHADVLEQQAVRRMELPVLQALSPEQFCWSALYATGQVDRMVAAARARLDKEKPLTATDLADPQKVAQRQQEAEAAAMKSLDAVVGRFVRLFAAQPGQPQDDFFATVDQALYAANGGEVLSWLNPSSGNLADRLIRTETPEAFAEEAYLAILTRRPEPEEIRDVAAYLADEPNKDRATRDITWALLTSVEFRFQQ